MLSAQQAPRTVPANPQVYLITVGQGAQVWEKFGHNALWFYDPAAGIDTAFNWGTFSFEQPGFLRRFLTGDTRYWVEGYPGQLLIDYYKRSDRGVVVQRLNFTPEQARKAYEFALWNAREENKYYRYDYFRDNCSTRVRDVIDYALGGALKAATATDRLPWTYRSESVRLVHDLKLTQLGIDVALGEPADQSLSTWEDMFIPMRMRDALRVVGIPRGANVAAAPLVAEERVLYQSREYRERATVPRLWIPYLIVGLLLAAELLVVGRVGERSPAADRAFRIEAAIWAFLTGLLGLVLLLAWTSTQHVFWYRNENLLLLNPLALWLAVLAVMSLRRERWTRTAAITAALVAMLSGIALILNGLPGFTQDNLPIILLLLPPHFAVASGLWRRTVLRPRSAVGVASPTR